MKERKIKETLQGKLTQINSNRMELVYIMQNCIAEVKRDILYYSVRLKTSEVFAGQAILVWKIYLKTIQDKSKEFFVHC